MAETQAFLMTAQNAMLEPAVWVHPAVLPVAYGYMVCTNVVNLMYGKNTTTSFAYTWAQPDGMTFGVWGLIYALQLVFCIAQLAIKHIRHDERVILARPAIAMGYILCGTWLIVNTEANMGGLSSYWMAAVVLVAYVLYMFIGVYWYIARDNNPYKGLVDEDLDEEDVRDLEKRSIKQEDNSSWASLKRKMQYRFLVWYPMSTNLAWITLASVINIASCVLDVEYLYSGHIVAFGGPDWAIGVALGATFLALHVSLVKADLGYAGVTIWALAGVYRNQQPTSNFPHQQNETLADAALLCIGLISLGIFLGSVNHIISHYYGPRGLFGNKCRRSKAGTRSPSSKRETSNSFQTPKDESNEATAPSGAAAQNDQERESIKAIQAV